MAKIGINIATGSLQKPDMIVGIDLGTTHSVVAIIHPDSNQPLAIKEHDSSSLIPSVVHFADDGTITVGEGALRHLATEPQNTIFSVKKLIGKSYRDIRQNASFFTYKIVDDHSVSSVKVQVGNQMYTPTELCSFILKELKKRAEHILKTPVSKAVITVPAYFNDTQRQGTLDAGKLAGLEVLQIINEPTAASMAYGLGLQKDEHKTIAVYHLGGGTFDISILKISKGIVEVLSTNADTWLGGDDFDNVIVELWMKEHNIPAQALSTDKELSRQFTLMAEKAKRHLSYSDVFKGSAGGFGLELTRARFETAIHPQIDRTIQCCDNALKDAHVTKTAIDVIITVGGSTRIPLVKKTVSEFFGAPVNDSLNPDEVVALGAAIQAGILAGNNTESLPDSLSNAGEDIQAKGLEEARIQAHQIIGTSERFLKKNEPSLSIEEIEHTRRAIGEVIAVFNSGDKDLIYEKIQALNQVAKRYAERIMERN